MSEVPLYRPYLGGHDLLRFNYEPLAISEIRPPVRPYRGTSLMKQPPPLGPP